MVGIIAILAGSALGKPILELLYGSEVASHTELLNPLILSSILLGATAFFNNLLIAVRSLRIMVVGSFIALAASAILSQPLLVLFGMNGATIALMVASTASIVTSCIGIALQIKARFHSNRTS